MWLNVFEENMSTAFEALQNLHFIFMTFWKSNFEIVTYMNDTSVGVLPLCFFICLKSW